MAAQALVTSSVMQTIMGVVGVGTSVVTGAAGAGSGTAIQNAASNFQFNDKGGVYDSPSLSAYSNQVYDSPQFFAFAKGPAYLARPGRRPSCH